MSSFLPFDIIRLIVDIIGDNKDIDLLKELSLVSHFFLQICRKHVFATVELYGPGPKRPASSKQGFIKLLENNPDIVKYIRKLTYNLSHDDVFLSPTLPNLLQTISHLDSFTITSVIQSGRLDWNTLDSSLESALLSLMHLPTVNHIEIAMIKDFPFSALTTCPNLNWLDIMYVDFMTPSHTENIHLEVPRIHRFSASMSTMATKELLHAKRRDGRLAFNFRDLKQLSVPFADLEDEQNARRLLQNAEHLEVLRMEAADRQGLAGLRDMISPSARTLKLLYMSLPLGDWLPIPLAGLCEELEAMAGHNVLETLEFRIDVEGFETGSTIGYIIQKLEEVLMKPGWSTLKQVSLEISIACCLVPRPTSAQLSDKLQSLPQKYLSRLSNLESITFNYSVYVVKCVYDQD